MMTRIFQIDAFTDRPFAGNPAAVCWLEQPADEAWMQAVAAEMNLAETAFVQPLSDGYHLRWFTPKLEVDLCGHATLAAAHALWTEGLASDDQSPLRFHTRSGILTASRHESSIELDFPATPPAPCAVPPGLSDALGITPREVLRTSFDYFVVVDQPSSLRSLTPDFRKLSAIETRGFIVTSRSDDPRYDFLSRFFAPAAGIDEDPVTGSAHCALAPYWSCQLNRLTMLGFQASQRGGQVKVNLQGDRVVLGGQAVTVLRGTIV